MATPVVPSNTARVQLIDEFGVVYKATGGGSSVEIQVEGVDNASQTLVNFVSGTPANCTISNPSGGIVQFDITAAGTGDVVGPASAVNADIAVFNGITGKLIADGGTTIAAINSSIAGKLSTVTADAPLSGSGTSGSHLVISQAGAATNGYLSSIDWNTFNNKQAAGSYLTAVTADAPLSGSGTSGSHLVAAVFVGSGASHATGIVPDPGASAGTTKFLREDASWAVPAGGGGTVVFNVPGLRLTVVSGDPNPSGNTTAAGTLYWTPSDSGNVWYWDGAAWQVETITEQSLALTLTSGKNYDVFYLHGTGLVLSSAWTNDTTRADALGTQNGVKVLASDHTKLWIGTIRASGTNITEDSASKRFIWNTYNQTGRLLSKSSTTSHSYASTTARSWNNDAANQVEFVVGDTQTETINLFGDVDTGTFGAIIGAVYAVIDWTSGYGAADDAQIAFGNGRISNALSAVKQVSLGYHYIRAVEAAFNGTSTFPQFAITSKFQM